MHVFLRWWSDATPGKAKLMDDENGAKRAILKKYPKAEFGGWHKTGLMKDGGEQKYAWETKGARFSNANPVADILLCT